MKYLIVFFLAVSCAYGQGFDLNSQQDTYFVYDNQNRKLGTWMRSGPSWTYRESPGISRRTKVLPSTGKKLLFSPQPTNTPRRYNY